MNEKETVIREYFYCWLSKQCKKLTKIFDENVVYNECYGPIYHGIDDVMKWFIQWNEYAKVLRWDIKSIINSEDILVVEWYFKCLYKGKIDEFDGVSLVEFNKQNKIVSIKEFQSKVNHYYPYEDKRELREFFNIPIFTEVLIQNIKSLYITNGKLKTWEHVCNVAKVSGELAERFHLDKDICILSAYLHDIAAIIDPKDMIEYIKDNNMYLDEAERRYPFLLHQRFSSIIAKDIFNITDERILSSVECHTTLKINATKYDMVLFIADKLAWDQEGIPPFYYRVNKALEVSLNHSALEYMKYMFENKLMLYPHEWIKYSYRWLSETV